MVSQKKKRSPVPTVPKKFLSCPTEAVGRLTLYVCPKIMGKNLLKIDGCWWCFDDFPYENASFGGLGPPFSETPKWSHFGWSCDLWDPSCFWPKCWMLPLTEITHLDLWGYWETHQLIYIYTCIYIYAERERAREINMVLAWMFKFHLDTIWIQSGSLFFPTSLVKYHWFRASTVTPTLCALTQGVASTSHRFHLSPRHGSWWSWWWEGWEAEDIAGWNFSALEMLML